MHILHLTNAFLSVTENWIYNQIVFNRRCRSSVLCQYRRNEAQFPHDAVYPVHRRYSFFTLCDQQIARWRGKYRSGPALRTIRRIKPDVIHGHFAFESWWHLTAIRHGNLPLATTFYGIDISKLPRLPVWRKRYAELFGYGSAFIVEGPCMARQLAALGCPEEKIHCIPIGVDIESLRGLKSQRSDESVRVLFTGLSREKKGSLHAAQAFGTVAAKHPGLRMDIIGEGNYRDRVDQTIKRSGIIDKHIFHGTIPVGRYREILREADIVLAPSITAADGDTEGGAPVTVIEAQVMGIPVVGTFHCDIPMVVHNGETGLLCAEKDVAALAANLERLVTDAPLRKRMGEAAAARATRQHDIRKQVEKITNIYFHVKTMAARNPASPIK